jgi:hypothetical protein
VVSKGTDISDTPDVLEQMARYDPGGPDELAACHDPHGGARETTRPSGRRSKMAVSPDCL